MTRRGMTVFFLPGLLLFLAFVLWPSVWALWDSFYAHDVGARRYVGLSHYVYAWNDTRFRAAFWNNLRYLGWTLIFEVGLGLVLAVALHRDTRFHRFLQVAFFSPAVLSLVVIGLAFGFLVKDGVGLLPRLLEGGISFLGEESAVLTISVVSGWAYCGLYMMIFLAGLSTIPDEVLEAARLEGAGAWTLFWTIQLPMLRPVLAVALLLCATGAFKAFDLFWVMLPNQEHSEIVSTLLVREVLRFDNRGYGNSLAVLLTLFVLLATAAAWMLQSIWNRSLGREKTI